MPSTSGGAGQQRGPIELLERQMWEGINQDRLAHQEEKQGQGETRGNRLPLNWDEKLAQIARAHSEDMVRRSFFSHISPDGLSLVDRLSKAGIPWNSLGENISRNHYDVPGTEAALMRNAHRQNILNPEFTHVGVGIVRLPDGALYITQVFAQEPQ